MGLLRYFPLRGLPDRKKELSNIHCPIHTITAYNTGLRQGRPVLLVINPAGLPSTISHLIASYNPAEEITTARQTTPRQILRHPFLSCTLSFASWMLRPFLPKVSFTPFIQLFLGLPLLLTPLTSESYTLLTILSFPILSTCPNHLSTPSSILSLTPTFLPHNSLIRTFGTISILLRPQIFLRQFISTASILSYSHNFTFTFIYCQLPSPTHTIKLL